jgi:hypothetical protein
MSAYRSSRSFTKKAPSSRTKQPARKVQEKTITIAVRAFFLAVAIAPDDLDEVLASLQFKRIILSYCRAEDWVYVRCARSRAMAVQRLLQGDEDVRRDEGSKRSRAKPGAE